MKVSHVADFHKCPVLVW